MGKFELKKLPKGFRYLFTVREIKEMENDTGLIFSKVTNGIFTNSEKFNSENTIQSHIRGFSIQSKKIDSIWDFSFYLNGFREELLTEIQELDIKEQLIKKIKDYLKTISTSKETDLYKNPELIGYFYITNYKPRVSWTEKK